MKSKLLAFLLFFISIQSISANIEIYWTDDNNNRISVTDEQNELKFHNNGETNHVGTQCYEMFWVFNGGSEPVALGSIKMEPRDPSKSLTPTTIKTVYCATDLEDLDPIKPDEGSWIAIKAIGLVVGDYVGKLNFYEKSAADSSKKPVSLGTVNVRFIVEAGNPSDGNSHFIPKSIPRSSLRYTGNYRFESDVVGNFEYIPNSFHDIKHDVLGPLYWGENVNDPKIYINSVWYGTFDTWVIDANGATCRFPDLQSYTFDGFFRVNIEGGSTPFYSYNRGEWINAIGGVLPYDAERHYKAAEHLVGLYQGKIHEVRLRRDQTATLKQGDPLLPQLYSELKGINEYYSNKIASRIRFHASRGAGAWRVFEESGGAPATVEALKQWIPQCERMYDLENELTQTMQTAFYDEFLPILSSKWSNPGERLTRDIFMSGKYYDWSAPRIKLSYIWPGTFTMGSPRGEHKRNTDETQHTVTLSKGYWIGTYEVSQYQYEHMMGNNPSYNEYWDRPVERVSWNQAMAFCGELNLRLRGMNYIPQNFGFSLPTEAQWEYACRAGSTTAYHFGSNSNLLYQYGNYQRVADRNRTSVRGRFKPNNWGLYDMAGNVWEWCRDWYGSYPKGGHHIDPMGPGTGTKRVRRGGSYSSSYDNSRSAEREGYTPTSQYTNTGFRIVLESTQ